ncbi:MAG: hypothetical protein RSB96_04420, partial [Oscillospiraceae bacterium]
MSLYLKNGTYASNDCGGLHTVSDTHAFLQQIITQLQVKRGSFLYDKTLGSSLYTLKNLSPSDLQVTAYRYVFDSLSTLNFITLSHVS